MSKGDFARVYIHTGAGVQDFTVMASQNGRKIELEVDSKEVVATELTRGGTPVRKIQFPRTVVVAIESEISE